MTETGSTTVEERVLFEGRPALVPSVLELLLAVVTLGIWLIPLWWRSRSVHYRITDRRVVIRTGVLSERLEQTDLYRINDYSVERPIGQKLMGTGNLHLVTLDRSTPEIRIAGLATDVVALYEELRRATEADKQKRGVRLVDYE